MSALRSTSRSDRQMFDRPQARPSAPLDLRSVHGQLQFRPPPKQGFERAYSLDPCELVPEAEMNAGAKGDMPVRAALEIKLLRMPIGMRIEVCCHEHGNDLLALLQPDTAELEVPADVARLGELHRRAGSAIGTTLHRSQSRELMRARATLMPHSVYCTGAHLSTAKPDGTGQPRPRLAVPRPPPWRGYSSLLRGRVGATSLLPRGAHLLPERTRAISGKPSCLTSRNQSEPIEAYSR